MRKKAQSWMIKALFAIIIIVFVFFYGFGRREGRRSIIAEVNGTNITDTLFLSEYQKAYQNLVRLYQSMYRDQFDESMIDRQALTQRVLNDLIEETLITQEAEKLSLRVSPQELQAAVHSTPAFQVDGKFNQQRFLAILQMNGMSVEEFQEMEARKQLITKLTDLISLGAIEISNQEILNAYTMENEKINVQFVRFNSTAYEPSITVEDSDLESYFSKNSARFEIPPKIQLRYLVFPFDDFLKTVDISPQEVEEEYAYNRDRYQVPKKVKISHILIESEAIESEAENGEKSLEEARKKAEQILEEAKKGEDFAALARTHSMDLASAKEGGSLGWLTQGQKVPEFAEVAFFLEKGEIAPLQEGDDGFHIVKVDDVQEERVKSLEEVEAQIRDELARAKSRQMAEEEAQEAFFAVYDTKDLEGYAAEKGRALKTTELFSRSQRLEEVDGNLAFNDHAFSLSQGEVSSPLEIGKNYYLLKVIKRENPRIPQFGEVKEKVRQEALREKAVEKARSAAEALLEEIKTGKPMAESAAMRGLKVEETGLFERGSNFIPGVGPAQVLGPAIFSLSQNNSLLDEVVSYGQVFFVMELKGEEPTDPEKFEKEKDQYAKRLYDEKRGRILRHWLDSLRKRSEIKIKEENLRL
jgi:peptidyl-prolyl cis-trans isomerase D